MNTTFESNSDYLIHYGVKGMKWGIRKERPTSNSYYGSNNYESNYSPASRAASSAAVNRSRIDSIKDRIRANRAMKQQKKFEKNEAKRMEVARKNPSKLKTSELDPVINRMKKELEVKQLNQQLKEYDRFNRTKKPKKTNDPKKMTPEQLQDRISRLETEKKFRDLSKPEKSQGRRVVESVLRDSGKTILTTAAIGAGTYALHYALQKKGGSKSGVDYQALANQMAPLKSPGDKKKKDK